MNDEMVMAAVTAGGTVGAAVVLFAAEVTTGIEQNTYTMGALLALGIGVIGRLWKTMRDDAAKANHERREADRQVAAELERLRRRVDELTDKLIERGGTP